jgi:transposase InsO family protein
MNGRYVPMSVRRLIVSVELEGLNVAEFCRQHGVGRTLFYDLRRRFAEEGEGALELRSRAPQRVANRISAQLEDRIVEWRKQLETQGLDAGPGTIAFHLWGAGIKPPSEATIWRVLSRRGFVLPQPEKAPQHAYRSFAAARANECWQIDATDWQLADGTLVKIINLIDDCTRLLVSAVAVRSCNTETAFSAFCAGAERWDWPARFLSDNAQEFRSGLAAAVRPLGVEAGHSRPYHPQTCGKVERFQQTEKKWLTVQPAADNLDELQTQLDRFTHIYNHQRPHRALGRRIPAQVYADTPKAGPADRPLNQPTTIHRMKVNNGICYIGQRLGISVTAAYTGQTATVIITGANCHVFIAGKLIRQLHLDPTRRIQPIYPRPGQPPKDAKHG